MTDSVIPAISPEAFLVRVRGCSTLGDLERLHHFICRTVRASERTWYITQIDEREDTLMKHFYREAGYLYSDT